MEEPRHGCTECPCNCAYEGSDEREDQEPAGPDCDTQGNKHYFVCRERSSMFQVTRGMKGRLESRESADRKTE